MTGPGGAGRPERIGRYRVVEVIGTGAFATVYRAVDERLDATVAVKLLADNHSVDPGVRERFVQEGRLLRRARNRHLVVVHDLGETDRAQPYLVLEWADRGDLGSRLAERHGAGGRATPADGLVLARALAAALGALHAIRVVHRDLTPRNLLLRSDTGAGALAPDSPGTAGSPSPRSVHDRAPRPGGAEPTGHTGVIGVDEHVVVADLGLSKDLARASGLTLATGTSGFAAPEQREVGAVVDHRADLWAASALLVWLATGDAPDDGGAWQARVREAAWPPEAVSHLARGLSPTPGARPPSVEAWLHGLEDTLGRPTTTARLGGGPPGHEADGRGIGHGDPSPPSERPARRMRTGWARRSVAVAAVLVAAAAGYGLAGQDAGGRPAVTSEALAGGRERTVTEAHGVTITVEGPREVPVGEPASWSATVEGATSWAWVAPDGSMHGEAERLDVVPATSGRLTVRLVAAGDGGRLVEAEHEVRALDE